MASTAILKFPSLTNGLFIRPYSPTLWHLAKIINKDAKITISTWTVFSKGSRLLQSKHSHYFVIVLRGLDLKSPHGPKIFTDAPKTKPPKDIRAQRDRER